ncbi:MAG: glycosyltransferase [Leptolyngbya sp. DLM2.Bin15]|nr:MAG: glycosyltransferase [Leptolyngbya sp. DLM2.Bin15]
MTDPPAPILVHVLNGLALGGNEHLCLQLVRHAPSPIQHRVLNLNPDCQTMRSQFLDAGAQVVDCAYQPRQRLRFLYQVATYVRRQRPQAVVVYTFGLHLLVGLAACWAGGATVVARAGNPLPKDPRQQRLWVRIVQGSRLLGIPIYSCSQAVHESFTRVTPLPAGSRAIPNGCDLQAIARRAQQTRQSRSDRPTVIGMVARLNAIKDQATLLRAIALLHADHPEIALWLVGDGDQRSTLEALAVDLGLAKVVTFWGDRADVPDLLGKMHLYAFSTTADEGFGIALIEAMAAGLPMVASDVPACREVLGTAGCLVPPGDAKSLAVALETWLDPALRQAWGDRAYQRALEHYTMDTCAATWYRELGWTQEVVG